MSLDAERAAAAAARGRRGRTASARCGLRVKASPRRGPAATKAVAHLVADFEIRRRRWPGPSQACSSLAGAAVPAQGRHGGLEHAGGQSAPAGMRRGDHGAIPARQQHRQAVRRQHRAARRPAARLTAASACSGRSAASRSATTMPCTCSQPVRLGGQVGALRAAARGCSRRPRGRRRHALPRFRAAHGDRADAARARGGQRAHAGRRLASRAEQDCAALRSLHRSRSTASRRSKSAGSGASTSMALPVTGCSKPSRAACSAWRLKAFSAARSCGVAPGGELPPAAIEPDRRPADGRCAPGARGSGACGRSRACTRSRRVARRSAPRAGSA